MADRLPDLDCEKLVFSASSRLGHARPISEYEAKGIMRDRDLHFVVANDVPDSTTTTSESDVIKAPTPCQPSVWYDAFGTGNVYEVDDRDMLSISKIDDFEFQTDWQSVQLFDPADIGVEIELGTPYMELTVRNTNLAVDEAKLRDPENAVNIKHKIALDVRCDPEGKFILTLMEFRASDCSEGSRRLPINELAWQTFHLAAGDKTRNLQVLFICDIMNSGFEAVLEQAHRDTMRPMDKLAAWTREDEPHFSRLLGTDNVSGKVLQLTNHHNAVGNKRVAKIITATPEVKNHMAQENGEFTAALVLEAIPEADLAATREELEDGVSQSSWLSMADDTPVVKNHQDQESGELTAALVLEPIPEADLAPMREHVVSQLNWPSMADDIAAEGEW